MKEIKFRGKRKDTGEWVYGYYTRNDESGRCYITTQSKTGGAHPWEVDPATVGQYTGLKDKDGKEIYKGDILGRDDNKWYVLFTHCGWSCNPISSSDSHPLLHSIARYVTVVGNIWDNPELLREGGGFK